MVDIKTKRRIEVTINERWMEWKLFGELRRKEMKERKELQVKKSRCGRGKQLPLGREGVKKCCSKRRSKTQHGNTVALGWVGLGWVRLSHCLPVYFELFSDSSI